MAGFACLFKAKILIPVALLFPASTSQHLSLKVPQTHWYMASFERVGETETQILPLRKNGSPPGDQGGWEEPETADPPPAAPPEVSQVISLLGCQVWWQQCGPSLEES